MINLYIKLFGGLQCTNENLDVFDSKKIIVQLPKALAIKEIHDLLKLNKDNLVYIVNGKAELVDFVISEDSTISIFPPMGDRK